MPSLEIPSFIFIYRVERCQVTLDLLLILLFLFLLSNNEIFSFFLFFFSSLTHPVCAEKQKEIFKGIRAFVQVRKKFSLFFFRRDTFEKRVHKHLPGERNPVSSMRRRLYAQQRSIVIRGRSF